MRYASGGLTSHTLCRICGCRGGCGSRLVLRGGLGTGDAVTRGSSFKSDDAVEVGGSVNRAGVTDSGPSVRIDSYHPNETSQVRPRDQAPRFGGRVRWASADFSGGRNSVHFWEVGSMVRVWSKEEQVANRDRFWSMVGSGVSVTALRVGPDRGHHRRPPVDRTIGRRRPSHRRPRPPHQNHRSDHPS